MTKTESRQNAIRKRNKTKYNEENKDVRIKTNKMTKTVNQDKTKLGKQSRQHTIRKTKKRKSKQK